MKHVVVLVMLIEFTSVYFICGLKSMQELEYYIIGLDLDDL